MGVYYTNRIQLTQKSCAERRTQPMLRQTRHALRLLSSKPRSRTQVVRRWIETGDERCPLASVWFALEPTDTTRNDEPHSTQPAFSFLPVEGRPFSLRPQDLHLQCQAIRPPISLQINNISIARFPMPIRHTGHTTSHRSTSSNPSRTHQISTHSAKPKSKAKPIVSKTLRNNWQEGVPTLVSRSINVRHAELNLR